MICAAVALCLAQATALPEYTRLLNSASQLIRENRLDAAIRELTQAAALEPRSALVHLLLGQAYLGKGTAELVAQAKAEFQQAKELDPGQVLPSFYIAKIDLDLGRISQAERELQQALAKRPAEHYLLAMLGEVRRRQGKLDEAIELTTKALEAGPEALPVHYYRALAWWDRKDDSRALKDLQVVLDSPFATIEAYVTAGVIHLHAGRLAQAEASFRKAIETDPNRAEPRLRLAQVLRRQRRFDLALKELSRVESAPQLSSAYFQKLLADAACEEGLIRNDQGDAAGAKASFRRALEIDPSHQEAASRLRP
jgi:tetratricopeptide (TPR) repeat protein